MPSPPTTCPITWARSWRRPRSPANGRPGRASKGGSPCNRRSRSRPRRGSGGCSLLALVLLAVVGIALLATDPGACSRPAHRLGPRQRRRSPTTRRATSTATIRRRPSETALITGHEYDFGAAVLACTAVHVLFGSPRARRRPNPHIGRWSPTPTAAMSTSSSGSWPTGRGATGHPTARRWHSARQLREHAVHSRRDSPTAAVDPARCRDASMSFMAAPPDGRESPLRRDGRSSSADGLRRPHGQLRRPPRSMRQIRVSPTFDFGDPPFESRRQPASGERSAAGGDHALRCTCSTSPPATTYRSRRNGSTCHLSRRRVAARASPMDACVVLARSRSDGRAGWPSRRRTERARASVGVDFARVDGEQPTYEFPPDGDLVIASYPSETTATCSRWPWSRDRRFPAAAPALRT